MEFWGTNWFRIFFFQYCCRLLSCTQCDVISVFWLGMDRLTEFGFLDFFKLHWVMGSFGQKWYTNMVQNRKNEFSFKFLPIFYLFIKQTPANQSITNFGPLMKQSYDNGLNIDFTGDGKTSIIKHCIDGRIPSIHRNKYPSPCK